MKEYFTIKKNHIKGNYTISIGVGKTFIARDLQEVAYAIEHYFRYGLLNKPFNYQKHIEHGEQCDCCPLCRG